MYFLFLFYVCLSVSMYLPACMGSDLFAHLFLAIGFNWLSSDVFFNIKIRIFISICFDEAHLIILCWWLNPPDDLMIPSALPRFEFAVNGRTTGPKVCLGKRYLSAGP